MAATQGRLACKLYPSAFSGEFVFFVNTADGQDYEGIVPRHYAKFSVQPVKDGVDGQVEVRVLSNGGNKTRVFVPDGQILTVCADKVHI